MKANKVTYELVPPHQHRRNAAERAIRTLKNQNGVIVQKMLVLMFLALFVVDTFSTPYTDLYQDYLHQHLHQ